MDIVFFFHFLNAKTYFLNVNLREHHGKFLIRLCANDFNKPYAFFDVFIYFLFLKNDFLRL